MNSGNSPQLLQLASIAGLLLAIAAGALASWVAGPGTSGALIASLVAGGVVLEAAVVFSLVILAFGVLRLPSTTRTRRVRMLAPGALVVEADMTREFRAWIDGNRVAPASVSRFGVTITVEPAGLVVWAGTGFAPIPATRIAWASVSRVMPPDPKLFIGAENSQGAVILVFSSGVLDLRIPLILPPSSGGETGDYAESIAVADALERIRSAAVRPGSIGT